ncbi:MAG: hypothetical protein ACLFR1_07465 [Spirochaetia bacterium]
MLFPKKLRQFYWEQELETYRVFLGKVEVTQDCTLNRLGGEIYVFHKPTGSYIKLPKVSVKKDNTRYEARFLHNTNGSLVIKNSDEVFFFLIQGENISDEVSASIVENHLYLYYPKNKGTYLVQEYLDYKKGSSFIPEFLTDDLVPVYFKGPADTMYLFWKGVNYSEAAIFVSIQNDLIVYHNQLSAQFVFENIARLKVGDNHLPIFSAEEDSAIYYALKGENFQLFYKGEPIASHTKNEHTDSGDLVIYFPEEQLWFQVEDIDRVCEYCFVAAPLILEKTDVIWMRSGGSARVILGGMDITADIELKDKGTDLFFIYTDDEYVLKDFTTSNENTWYSGKRV